MNAFAKLLQRNTSSLPMGHRLLTASLSSSPSSSFTRSLSTSGTTQQPATTLRKVAVLGAGGGIGQSLSLLLKANLASHISELACYDLVGTPGVAADLSHIPPPNGMSRTMKVTGHLPSLRSSAWPPKAVEDEGLAAALQGAEVVVIPAGVPRRLGMTRDDLLKVNAEAIQTLMNGVAQHCPDAFVAIITNPVNSVVPTAAEVLKLHGAYNPKKLAGVTTLDVCRANAFVAQHLRASSNVAEDELRNINVPVVGGHNGITILPLFSRIPNFQPTDEAREALTVRVQFGGDEILKAKEGKGAATLNMAYAGYRFTDSVLRALDGEEGILECAYVQSTIVPDTPFFATPCSLGVDGIEQVHGIGEMSDYEKQWFDKLVPLLQKQIQMGVDFVHG